MAAFTSFGRMLNKCVNNRTPESAYLSLIQILTATSSANAGISSSHLMFGKHTGLIASMYGVLQEMGRMYRRGNALPGSNMFEIHFSFDSLISLLRRAMTNSDSAERPAQTPAVMVVLQFFVTPLGCYHTFIKDYFEYELLPDKPDCDKYYSYTVLTVLIMSGTSPGFSIAANQHCSFPLFWLLLSIVHNTKTSLRLLRRRRKTFSMRVISQTSSWDQFMQPPCS